MSNSPTPGDPVRVDGTAGNDLLTDSTPRAVIFGGDGDDTFSGFADDASLIGGAGDDLFVLDGQDADLFFGGIGGGHDTLSGTLGVSVRFQNSASNITQLQFADVAEGAQVFFGANRDTSILFEGISVNTLIQSHLNARTIFYFGDRSLGTNASDVSIHSSFGNPNVIGFDGNDVLSGTHLYGMGDNDTLLGNSLDGQMFGGGGDDLLDGGGGDDVAHGGAGADVFVVGLGDGVDSILDFTVGLDRIDLTERAASFDQLSFVSVNGGTLLQRLDVDLAILEGVDPNTLSETDFIGLRPPGSSSTGILLTGTDDTDFLEGTALDDTLVGGLGRDFLTGFDGADVYVVSADDDAVDEVYTFSASEDVIDLSDFGISFADLTVEAGSGTTAGQRTDVKVDGERVIMLVGDSTDLLTKANFIGVADAPGDPATLSVDLDFAATNAAELLEGGTGRDTIDARGGNDTIHGFENDDFLNGSVGDDRVFGGSGDDFLIADQGDDLLFGGEGDDTLHSTSGNSTLEGGVGADVFVVAAFNGDIAVVADFDPAEDTLDFSNIAPVPQLTFAQQGDDVIVSRVNGPFLRVENVDLGDLNNQNMRSDQDHQIDGDNTPNDVIGTEFNDRISGFDRDDTIDGRGGDDHIDGGSGADLLIGGAGDDNINAGLDSASDTLIGGAGADTLNGGRGQDVFVAGDEDLAVDVIFDFNRNGIQDLMDLSALNTSFQNLTFQDDPSGVIVLDRGRAVFQLLNIEASELDESDFNFDPPPVQIVGTDSADTLTGGSDAEQIFGGIGPDLLQGGAGDDLLAGGSGYDTLDGGTGVDTLTGGNGGDTFVVRAGEGVDIVTDFTSGLDRIDVGSLGIEFDDLSITQDGNDALVALNGSDLMRLQDINAATMTVADFAGVPQPVVLNPINGTSAADTLDGTNAADAISGGIGPDLLSGNGGGDLLTGGFGYDTLDGGAGVDTLTGDNGGDTFVIRAGEGVDIITDFTTGLDQIDLGSLGVAFDALSIAQQGNDAVVNVDGADLLRLQNIDAATIGAGDFIGLSQTGALNPVNGTSAADTLDGTGAADAISGGIGPDLLRGNDGDDLLEGGFGYDTLDGGAGVDTLTGDNGGDTFVIRAGEGVDIITDFTSGLDRIDLGSLNTSFDALSLTQQGGDAIVAANGSDLVRLQDINVGTLGAEDFVGLSQAAGLNPIHGTAAADVLDGTAAADAISGGIGPDLLRGGDGGDLLEGGFGYDTLEGGAGADTLTGDNGGDTFVATSDDAIVDLVTDFTSGLDTLDLSALSTAFGNLSFEDGNDGVLVLDQGNGVFRLQDVVAADLDQNDFTF